MSEITPEELIKTVHIKIKNETPTVTRSARSASVIPIPIDPTLTHQGEAADAKATGDAITNVWNGATVNGKAPVNKAFVVYSTDILMTDDPGAQTVEQAIQTVGDRTASDIMYDADELITVRAAIDGIMDELDTELTESEIDDIFDEVFGGEE